MWCCGRVSVRLCGRAFVVATLQFSVLNICRKAAVEQSKPNLENLSVASSDDLQRDLAMRL